MKTILPVFLGVSLALAAAGAAGQAQMAEQKQVHLAIERQSLRDALNEWAKQTGFQLVSELSGEFVAPSVTGMLTPQAALDQLLAGTPLTYEWLTDRVVAIRDKTKASHARWQTSGDEHKQPRLELAQGDRPSAAERMAASSAVAGRRGSVDGGQSTDRVELEEIEIGRAHV